MKILKPFLFGLLQVTLVSLNTYQISKFYLVGAFIVGFLISLTWTFNVRTALGTWRDRLSYSTGAAVGTLTGMYMGKLLYEVF